MSKSLRECVNKNNREYKLLFHRWVVIKYERNIEVNALVERRDGSIEMIEYKDVIFLNNSL